MKKFVLCVMCVALLTHTVQAQSCGGVVRSTPVRDLVVARPKPMLTLLQKISSKRSVECSGVRASSCSGASVQAGFGGCSGR